jgi:hypothetical protein
VTLNEAIAGLEHARQELGGDAELFMVDDLPVTQLSVIGGCVYVTDASPEELAEEHAKRNDVWVIAGAGLHRLPY